jgi:hypothetical protein
MKKVNLYMLLLAGASLFSSCKKFLDEKPDKQLLIPKTVDEYQRLLDTNFEMNLNTAFSGILSADEYYQTTADFNGLSEPLRYMYTWQDNSSQEDQGGNDWANTYAQVYNTNIALEGMEKVERNAGNQAKWDNVKGTALFFRGRLFLEAALIWAKAYEPSTATTDPGIPLTRTSDFNVKTTRPNMKDTYEQILKDLKGSVPLLPAVAAHAMRPSKAAAYAFLSRTYLAMRDYPNAGKYADSVLQINNKLVDFATLNSFDIWPMEGYRSPEMIMFFQLDVTLTFRITDEFYNSYSADDYRQDLYYEENRDGSKGFRGSYTGDYSYFSGIATDELYLTRAECFARAGNAAEAMEDLNTLLKKRIYKFTDLTATDANAALKIILKERKKELVLRGVRWLDLKRLNKEPEHQVTIKREVAGKVYELRPNDPKYALPIPTRIIELSGIAQNVR